MFSRINAEIRTSKKGFTVIIIINSFEVVRISVFVTGSVLNLQVKGLNEVNMKETDIGFSLKLKTMVQK